MCGTEDRQPFNQLPLPLRGSQNTQQGGSRGLEPCYQWQKKEHAHCSQDTTETSIPQTHSRMVQQGNTMILLKFSTALTAHSEYT